MHKHNFTLFSAVLISLISYQVSLGLELYLKPKNPGERNFLLSLLPDNQRLTLNPIANINGLPAGIPYLGHYHNPYLVRELLGLIQAPADLLKTPGAPAEIRAQLPDGIQTTFYIVIWGPMLDELALTTHNNAIFHPVAVAWTGQPRPNINIDGGLFLPQNVVPAAGESISFGSLQAINVNVHPAEGGGDACSPDNARFNVTPGAAASFWLVGRYQQRAVVTYNLILNNAELTDIMRAAGHAASNLGELTNNLQALAGRDLVVQQFITTIERLLGGKYSALADMIEAAGIAEAKSGRETSASRVTNWVTGSEESDLLAAQMASLVLDPVVADDDLTAAEWEQIAQSGAVTAPTDHDRATGGGASSGDDTGYFSADEKYVPREWEEIADKDVVAPAARSGGGGGSASGGSTGDLTLEAEVAVALVEELLATVGQSTKQPATNFAIFELRGTAILELEELAQRVCQAQGRTADACRILQNGVKTAKAFLANNFISLARTNSERSAIKAYLTATGIF